jgi:hypothetical protein
MKLHETERVARSPGGTTATARVAVPGGWLYRTAVDGLGVAAAFVPDPEAEHCQFENIAPSPEGMWWEYWTGPKGEWVVGLRPAGQGASWEPSSAPQVYELAGAGWVAKTSDGRSLMRDTKVAAARWLVAQVEGA